MSTDLDNDLYNDLMADDAPEQEPEQQEPEEQVQEEGVKEEESTPPVESQESAAKDERFIPINALLDEREKRQRLEAELAQYKAQAQPAKEDDITEDELFSNPAAVLKRVQQEAYQAARIDMINMSEAILFETKPDAQEKLDAFKEAIQQNSTLYQQMLNSPNPAGFAYNEGAKFLTVKSMPTDMASYEKELRAKIEAELAAKYSQKPASKMPAYIPTTLSDVPNTKPGKDDGDFDFDSLFAT
jgi:hypothetical protein